MNCKFVNYRIAVANCDHRDFTKQFANTLKNIDDINKMKYLFNDAPGRFKPTAAQITDALFTEKQFLEEMPFNKLSGYFPGIEDGIPLTKLQIETFVNSHYSSIFL